MATVIPDTKAQSPDELREFGVLPADTLAQQTPDAIDPVVAQPQPVVLPPTPEFSTQKETDVSAGIKRQQDLTSQLAGQSELRTQQEQEQDIAGKEQTLQDITARMDLLNAEADQIPLQIQQESVGRGRTKGGTAVLEAGRLRKNAIAQLGTNASFQAAKGNLTLAQDLVDRAVAAEFDPIREQLAAEQANLQLLQQMPDLTTAEKQQVAQVQAQIDADKAQAEADQEEKKMISQVMLEAAPFATAEQLQQISESGSYNEAIFRAGPALGVEARNKFEQQQFSNEVALANLDLTAAAQDQRWNIFLEEMAFDKEKFNDTKNARTEAQFAKDLEKASESEEAKTTIQNDLVSATDKTLGLKAKMEELLTHPGMKGSVGTNPLYRSDFGTSAITGYKQDFLAKYNTFIATLTVENLDLMTGVLTDKDIQILQDDATSITRKTSEAKFKENMNGLIDIADRSIKKNGVTLEQVQFYNLVEHESDAREVAEMNNIPIMESSATNNNESYYTN